jgi:hypothetical protein
MGPKGCSETSVRNYHSTLRKLPEGRRSQDENCLLKESTAQTHFLLYSFLLTIDGNIDRIIRFFASHFVPQFTSIHSLIVSGWIFYHQFRLVNCASFIMIWSQCQLFAIAKPAKKEICYINSSCACSGLWLSSVYSRCLSGLTRKTMKFDGQLVDNTSKHACQTSPRHV